MFELIMHMAKMDNSDDVENIGIQMNESTKTTKCYNINVFNA